MVDLINLCDTLVATRNESF